MKTSHEFAKRAEIIQKAYMTLFPFLRIFLCLRLNRLLFECSVELIVIVETLIDVSKGIESWWSWFDWLENSSRVLLGNRLFFLGIGIVSWNKVVFCLVEWLRLSAEVENILLLFMNRSNLFFRWDCFSLKAML